MRYHVNTAGDVKPCSASQKDCPFGFHSDSFEDSQRMYESAQSEEMFSDLKQNDSPRVEEAALNAVLPRNSELRKKGIKHENELLEAAQKRVPLTSKQLESRLEYVNSMNAYLDNSGFNTEELYSQDRIEDAPIYTDERAEMHEAIVNDFMKEHSDVPNDGQAVMAGGLGGAGKGFTMSSSGVVDQSKYATVNPDDVKEEMAKRGMVPKVPGMTPMEASPLVHEEASHISKQIGFRLMREKKNMIYDVTMSGRGSSRKKLEQLTNEGYDTRAVFVDIEPALSKERAKKRYREGLEEYTVKHSGDGGRPLPNHLVDNQRSTVKGARSKNAVNLVALEKEGHFSERPAVFDNMGSSPERIEYSEFAGRMRTQ